MPLIYLGPWKLTFKYFSKMSYYSQNIKLLTHFIQMLILIEEVQNIICVHWPWAPQTNKNHTEKHKKWKFSLNINKAENNLFL